MEERPLECSQCKRKSEILYKEIVNGNMACWAMCRDCPILKKKLDGPGEGPLTYEKEGGLCCSHCKTTLESVLLGHPVGCRECYIIFKDVLVDQLAAMNKIAPKLKPSQKSRPSILHVGKTPELDQNAHVSSRIGALNEALSDALKGENYEQAAWVRDQIKAITESTHEKK